MSGLRHLERTEIDIEKWDHCIVQAHNAMIYPMSWYLDVVADHWSALVWGDYEAVMPIPYRIKLGFIRYVYQPCFTQQLGVYSNKHIDQNVINMFIDKMCSEYLYVHTNLNTACLAYRDQSLLTLRNNYVLDLNNTYEVLKSRFSSNAKLNIKRSLNYRITIRKNIDLNEVIRLFDENQTQYSDRYSALDYDKLQRLIMLLQVQNKVELVGLYSEQNVLCAGAVFLYYGKRKIFIFSGSNEIARKQKMMFFLFDEMVRKHAGEDLILDFEGSNNPGLANFYSGFSSANEQYPMIKINNLPWYFKLFKR